MTIFSLPPLPIKGEENDYVSRRVRSEQRIVAFLRSPLIKPIARFMFRACNKLLSYEAITEQYTRVEKVQSTLRNADVRSDSTGYRSSQIELGVAIGYQQEVDQGLNDSSFSKLLYERQQRIISELLLSNDVDKFVNFGVCYAYVDSLLAKQFPNVKFSGVDRSLLTKRYNEFIFGTSSNLSFEATDIRSFLSKEKAKNGIFFHARTATYVAKPILEDIYASARENGYRFIVGFEPFGISRITARPYDFSTSDQDSVAYLHDMIIHNYPAILDKHGYQLVHVNVLQTQHHHTDLRQLEFVAKSR
jgi:hypothetical protein